MAAGMNARALQRAVVRMHYDASFRAAMYAGAPVAGIDDDQRRLLTAPDPRAYATDPLRGPRLLTALLDEAPGCAAIVGARALDDFFASDAFAEALQGGSMAQALLMWLAPRCGDTATIEAAVARARRRRGAVGPGLARAPHVEVVRVSQGALERYAALRARLGPRPAEALAHGLVVDAGAHGIRSGDVDAQHVVISPGQDGAPELALISTGLYALLDAADEARTRTDMCHLVRELGADPGEEGEILDGIVRDGLLVDYNQGR